ncbi:MAG: hypothetical protein AVDCRST_MAG47-1959 [uncultured Nocardioidaceae bacterium]|uniref:Glycosyltransferase subfamily 4-like N-terminal domain-containing protein n=1 Tax=uncultured Nocardioidaceae bacterium TaxID=253824 RepID=A0A6J4NC13_9ACTN|nr:MAG: hypothetical protein AVDCRST_MAG47-1959 [uncultured Nocardioidaceae bacterium]
MRVLHVAEVTHGGVITLVDTYSRHQAAAGHDVHALLRPEVDDVPAVRHDWSPVRRNPWALLRAERRLHQVAHALRPDVIHLHSFVPGVLGRTRSLQSAAAVVYQPHSFAFEAVPPAAAGLIARTERRMSRHTDRMVTNCHDEEAEGRSRGIVLPTTVVGLPVDTAHFAPRESEQATYQRDLGLDADFVAVCVGRLSRQKGQSLLAAAWEADPPPGAQLVFVGPGDPAEIAEAAPRTYGASILCAGAQDDVRPWLWAASVAVQPSLYEGQSVAMAEALACGVPVVMTDVNGAREAVAHEHERPAGAVVPVGDLRQVMSELTARQRQPELVASEAAVARERAVRLFSPETVMRRIENVYIEALAVHRASR